MRVPLTRKPFRAFPLLVHTSVWIAYGSFLHIANYLTDPTIKIINTVFYLVPLCLTFYTSIYCLHLYKHKGVPWSIASFFIVLIVIASIGYVYVYILLPLAGIRLYSSGELKDFIKYAVLGYVQYFSLALLYFYVQQSFRKERELRRLQEEKLRNELENAELKQQELRSQQEKLQLEYAFLQSQVNPHFLHNALNLLFEQAGKFSEDLAQNILKLSSMMRYSMESGKYDTGKVPIQKELLNLQLLIDINRLRFDSKAVHLTVEGEPDDHMVPPLSMITVVENAFKYGDLKDPLYPLLIKVLLRYRQVYFWCRNKKSNAERLHTPSNHIGLSNLRKRMELAFKGRYQINVKDEGDFYTFEFIINN